MRYFKLFFIILCMTFVTGCSSEEKVLYMSYSDSNDVSSMLHSNNADSSAANLFANDLCVIPKDSDVGGDSELIAKSLLLVDVTDNTMLYGDNVYDHLYPASITKLATTLVVLKRADLDSIVTVTEDNGGITESGAKLCKLKKGDTVVLRDLLTALLVYSGNDAGIEIAKHVAGTVEDFATMMNEEIAKLGAVNSHFVNPHGLHNDEHYTCAYDIYLMYDELLKYEEFKTMCSTKEFNMPYTNASGTASQHKYETTNLYFTGEESSPEGVTVVGGKTGTTVKAGKCLSLYCTDSNNKEYVAVILYGCDMYSDTLYSQMTHMLSKINK